MNSDNGVPKDHTDNPSNDHQVTATLQTESRLNPDTNASVYAPLQYSLTESDISDLYRLLCKLNSKKWIGKSEEDIRSLFVTVDGLKKLLKSELLEITKLLNIKLLAGEKVLDAFSKLTRVDLVNQLSRCIGNGEVLEKTKRKCRQKYPKSLQELANGILMKSTYPKQVLNIAYASCIWPERVKAWRNSSRVSEMVKVECETETYFKPYYVPEFNEERQDFEVFIYDKTRLATNLRKCVCLDRVEGITIKAWEAVASHSPDILNRGLIEVSSDGKILDQMKEQLAKTIFNESVEIEMDKMGFRKEAIFCNVVREALFIADDTPGISAKARCQKRLNLISWLNDGVQFGKFPPYGARVKGLSHILYEGLRSSMEGKLYLYPLTKSGTYCARAPSTLCSESFFSSMQDMDPWGQGILTTDGVKKHISDFTTVTAMKMEEDRYGDKAHVARQNRNKNKNMT